MSIHFAKRVPFIFLCPASRIAPRLPGTCSEDMLVGMAPPSPKRPSAGLEPARLPRFHYLTLYPVSAETRRHRHDHPELGYVMSGSFALHYRKKGTTETVPLKRHQVFWMPPGLFHFEKPVGSRIAEVMYLGARWGPAENEREFHAWTLNPLNPVKTLLLYLLEARENGAHARPLALACALVLESLDLAAKPRVTTASGAEPKALLHRADNFIGSHFGESSFGPAELAALLGVSLRLLQLEFKKSRGCSPVDAIRRARVNRARELLAFTRESIPVISRLCGFGSPGYFMRTFRSQVGETAQQYRQAHALRERAPVRHFYPPTPEGIEQARE